MVRIGWVDFKKETERPQFSWLVRARREIFLGLLSTLRHESHAGMNGWELRLRRCSVVELRKTGLNRLNIRGESCNNDKRQRIDW